MAWNPNSSVEEGGKVLALVAVLASLYMWYFLRGFWNAGLLSTFLILFALLGMYLSTRTRMEELKERRTQARTFEREASLGESELDEARRREDKRKNIRSASIVDDGLTPFGAWYRDSEPGRKITDDLERLGVSLEPREEDIFALEDADKELLSAHLKKLSADDSFRRLLGKL